jgi:hypothetical protein
MNHRLIVVGTALSLLIAGCLSTETPCHFFQIYQKTMYNNNWNIDSLHVYVFDDSTQYARDTMYHNFGTLKFVSSKPYSCNDNGAIMINGGSISGSLNYSTSANDNTGYLNGSPYNVGQFCVYGNLQLDGYGQPYNLCSIDSFWPGHMKIYGDPEYDNYGHYGPVIRYWEFFLSSK